MEPEMNATPQMTVGKMRGLDTLATDEGIFAILAIDHRDSLREVLPGEASDEEIVQFKKDLLRGVGSVASGAMLEPEYSIPHAIESGDVSGNTGFFAALEAQGYLADPWAGPTSMMPGWTANDAKRMGASGAKLLLPFHPDRAVHAAAQVEVCRQTAALCAELDIALLVEPVAFGMEGPDRRRIVVESVGRLTGTGLDVLKLEFPGDPDDPSGWADACAEVTETATVPWVLLSSGVTFDAYEQQLAAAFAAGCSGFTGGRAIWREAANASLADRGDVIAGQVLPRVQQLRDLAVSTARPWRTV
jgi:tagatose 1,6-diphosphate aldolase